MAAKEYTAELEELNAEDKAALIGTFDDLIVDTQQTGAAVLRFKRILKKVSSGAGDYLTKLIVDIASEATVKLMKNHP